MFIHLRMAALWLSLLLVIGNGRATGAILFQDTFTYPNGALVQVSTNWLTFSGTTGQVAVVDGRVRLNAADTEDVTAVLAGQPYPAATDTVIYIGMRMRWTNLPAGPGGGYFAMLKDAGTGNHKGRIFALTNGAPAGMFRLGVGNASNTAGVTNNTPLNLNADYVVVTRYAVSNTATTVWVDPAAEADPSLTDTNPATPTVVATLALRQSGGIGTLLIDEVVVATSFAEVISQFAPTPPSILVEPADQTIPEGSNAVFTVTAAGSAPLEYQWRWAGTNLPSQTNASLTLYGVGTNQAGGYQVVVTNFSGSVTSRLAKLTVTPVVPPPVLLVPPQDLVVTAGSNALFSVQAEGAAPLAYQWRWYGTNLAGATGPDLLLSSVALTQAGPYTVAVSNAGGITVSPPAQLTVNRAGPAPVPAFSVLTYNVKGNNATNWSTNMPQVQAVGRVVRHLQPDVITFNEIPHQYVWQMTNFVAAYLPGYYLATNSGTDGFIRSVIASRYEILWSYSWLDGTSLSAFGYTGNFTRDLFQAGIRVPGMPVPVNVFTTHLKATTSSPQADANKRAAEAAAISNFFVNVYLPGTNGLCPYVLTGDLNEDVERPAANDYSTGFPIQRLVSAPTGLRLTTPLNPVTKSDLTLSIQSTLNVRFDYVLPDSLLYSNIVSSQVFRSDVLTNPPPPNLASNDSRTASDHLPVMMVFASPYSQPFRISSFVRTNPGVALTWNSVRGQSYRVQASGVLGLWTNLSGVLTATGAQHTFTTNIGDTVKFFRVYQQP